MKMYVLGLPLNLSKPEYLNDCLQVTFPTATKDAFQIMASSGLSYGMSMIANFPMEILKHLSIYNGKSQQQ